ncbi:unnamed protein product [Amaranthus hypochondriacus]
MAAIVRRVSGSSRNRIFLHHLITEQASLYPSSSLSRNLHTFSLHNIASIGDSSSELRCQWQNPNHSLPHSAVPFSSAIVADTSNNTVKELHDKILESIKAKSSAPPNVWLWALVEKCKSSDDIKLLFDILEKLRIFRLSNLRIQDNFNCNLCLEVAKACVRAGTVKYGKRTICRHNVYGLTPTIGSANQLLFYAKEQKDVKLMVDIMNHLKKNDLPLQPATADIVFSICYAADNWELITKYSRRFLKAGVKLRKSTYEIWMEFASQRGDLESLWKIEKLRSDMYNQHTIKSGFSCAKGYLLEKKPESAASVIQAINQSFPDSKRQDIINELQKMVNEWPVEVIKHQKQENKKAVIDSLKADIPAMLSPLSNMGVKSNVNLEDLNSAEPLLS